MIMDSASASELIREKEEQTREDMEKKRGTPAPALTASGKFVPAVQIDKTNILLLGPTGSGKLQHTLVTLCHPHNASFSSRYPLNTIIRSYDPFVTSTICNAGILTRIFQPNHTSFRALSYSLIHSPPLLIHSPPLPPPLPPPHFHSILTQEKH